MYKINSQKGFIKIIVIIVIALIVLSYYGFDIEKTIKSPLTQKNLNYVQQIALSVWQNVLKTPIMYIWNFSTDFIKSKLGS